MAFSLYAPRWYGWQMLPGYGGERCVPYFSPIHVTRVQPLKTGQDWIEVDFFNAFYAEGVRDFSAKLKVLHRAENFLVALIGGGPSQDRVAVISHIEFGWLREFCPELIKAFPPESLGSPFSGSISCYLDGVFFQNPPLPAQPESLNSGSENEWLTACALRFDGYRFADDHGLEHQPAPFCAELLRTGRPPKDPQHAMAAMFMLQRNLMKEGVLSKTDAGWRIFRMLFVELCEIPTPEEYRVRDRYELWREDFVPALPAGKALIRHLHETCTYDSELAANPQLR